MGERDRSIVVREKHGLVTSLTLPKRGLSAQPVQEWNLQPTGEWDDAPAILATQPGHKFFKYFLN